MASNKYILMLGLISLFSSAAFAQQNDAGYDWRDSSKIATKNLPQQSEFLNNQYPYPAKPRSMWELGLSTGSTNIFGDISDGKFHYGVAGGLTLRKAISHTFSLRGGYFGSMAKGETNAYRARVGGQLGYKTWIHQLALDLIASLTPSSHYRGNPKMDIYLVGGIDLLAARVHYADPNGTQLSNKYSTFYGVMNRPGVYPATLNGTLGTILGYKNPITNRKAWTVLAGANVGGGVSFKLSKKVNIGVEQRFTFVPYDYLDAYKGGNSNDIISYSSAHLNLNLGSSAKRVEPLWWLNPNNFVYNELNRPEHMKIPPPVLPDADGDGVTDQFDMEPNTPAGVPVDVRGVAKDSDGDGVPDYKDKELLTPQKCFPVNADGEGNCPESACCTELRNKIEACPGCNALSCGLSNLPTIQFRSGRATLSKDAMSLLSGVASQVKSNPDCKVRVIGHGASDKRAQQLSWDRVNTVIRYLVEKQGISEDRFIFSYGEEGDPNSVDMMGTTESGPNNVPAPHPNLKK